VGNSGVSADQQSSASHQRSQPGQIELAGYNRVPTEASRACDGKTTGAFRDGSGDHDRVAGGCQGSRHCPETFDRPAASLRRGAGMHNHRIRDRRRLIRPSQAQLALVRRNPFQCEQPGPARHLVHLLAPRRAGDRRMIWMPMGNQPARAGREQIANALRSGAMQVDCKFRRRKQRNQLT
jgi:hypothetical protein